MGKFIIRRVLQAIPLLFIISFLAFWIYSLVPNTPFRAELALNPNVSEEDIRALEAKYGFDKPFPVRYVDWAWNAVRGDLGRSYFTKRPVFEMIFERLPATRTPLGVTADPGADVTRPWRHRRDVLCLLTDGVTDAVGVRKDHRYGEDRAVAHLTRMRARPAREILEAIFADLAAFTGGARAMDDRTVVVLRV